MKRGSMPGSSPLARGLRLSIPISGGSPGIIPARAGFTGPSLSAVMGVGDHPRSRGVYNDPITVGIAQWGSSPLARGLLLSVDDSGMPIRIIPARAGFTFWH